MKTMMNLGKGLALHIQPAGRAIAPIKQQTPRCVCRFRLLPQRVQTPGGAR